MTSRKPEMGDILSYRYLWSREAQRGVQEGSKARPSVVLLATEQDDDPLKVVLLPITHSEPNNLADAFLIPTDEAKSAGLDEAKNYVSLIEYNQFEWKGYDVESIPRSNPQTEYYGKISKDLLNQLVREVIVRKKRNQLSVVPRN